MDFFRRMFFSAKASWQNLGGKDDGYEDPILGGHHSGNSTTTNPANKDGITTASKKELKSTGKFIMLSMIVCGIEFCYAGETAFVSPTLLNLGVPQQYMTYIWCLSPLCGFFLTPVLGSASDRCFSKLGRRRPFIILFSVGIVIGLVFTSNGREIGLALGDSGEFQEVRPLDINGNASSSSSPATLVVPDPVAYRNSTEPTTTINSTSIYVSHYFRNHVIGTVFTVVGVILLDFSADACQSPSRAYLLDVTLPEQHTLGLSMFTVMAGLGGCIGYIMGGIDWSNTAIGRALGNQVRVVFTLILVIYLLALTVTITSNKEVPLGEFEPKPKKVKKKIVRYDHLAEEEEMDDEPRYHDVTNGEIDGAENGIRVQLKLSSVYNLNTSYQKHDYGEADQAKMDASSSENLAKNSETESSFGDGNEVANSFYQRSPHSDAMAGEGYDTTPSVTIKTYLLSIIHLPKSLRMLCLTNFLCWMSLVCYSLYFTDFVGQCIYGGDPKALPGSRERDVYEEGVRLGSWSMALYSISCSIVSFFMERLVKRFGAKRVYIVNQLVYCFGMALLAITRTKAASVILSLTAGVEYATIFTIPYIILAYYHDTETFQAGLVEDKRQIRGLGTDISLVTSMVFLAQFWLNLFMGIIVKAAGSTVAVIVTASVLSFLGAVSATRIVYLDL